MGSWTDAWVEEMSKAMKLNNLSLFVNGILERRIFLMFVRRRSSFFKIKCHVNRFMFIINNELNLINSPDRHFDAQNLFA